MLGRLEDPSEEEMEDSFLRYAGNVHAKLGGLILQCLGIHRNSSFEAPQRGTFLPPQRLGSIRFVTPFR